MPIDLAAKTIDELRTLVANHEKQGKTETDLFKAIVSQLQSRAIGNLRLDRTMAIIRDAASKGQLLSYGQIAKESGVSFNKVMFAMPKHLLEVCRHGHREGWPLLSAIVVSEDHLKDGVMDQVTLTGFCKCAVSLGYTVGDQAAFLKTQQKAVFKKATEVQS